MNEKQERPERKILIDEYMDALKEWQALNSQLANFYRRKKIEKIIENIPIYRAADEFLNKRANKINAPLPDVLLSDLAIKYIEMLKEEDQGDEENE